MKKRIIAEGIVGLALLGAAGAGIAGWYSEHERAAEMESQVAKLQLDQKRSVVLRSISNQMEDIAFQQKEISDEQREEALQQKRMADDMRQRAELNARMRWRHNIRPWYQNSRLRMHAMWQKTRD